MITSFYDNFSKSFEDYSIEERQLMAINATSIFDDSDTTNCIKKEIISFFNDWCKFIEKTISSYINLDLRKEIYNIPGISASYFNYDVDIIDIHDCTYHELHNCVRLSIYRPVPQNYKVIDFYNLYVSWCDPKYIIEECKRQLTLLYNHKTEMIDERNMANKHDAEVLKAIDNLID